MKALTSQSTTPLWLRRLLIVLGTAVVPLAIVLTGVAQPAGAGTPIPGGPGQNLLKTPELSQFVYLPSVSKKRAIGPVSTATLAQTPTATTTPTGTSTPPPIAGIYGRVTFHGNPAAGIPLNLWFYQGEQGGVRAVVTTDPEGRYQFLNVAPLAGGQSYQVVFGPNMGDGRYLYEWDGLELTSYTGGSVPGGDFDIADVPLLSPPDEAQVGLPVTFAWQVRPATTSDNYYIHISSLMNPDLEANLPDVGYTGSATMAQLPAGFSPDEDYYWEVWFDGPGGLGISYGARAITLGAAANAGTR